MDDSGVRGPRHAQPRPLRDWQRSMSPTRGPNTYGALAYGFSRWSPHFSLIALARWR